MSRRVFIAFCVLVPMAVHANPVMIDPVSLLAFCVVAFGALVVEAGVVALLLAWRGFAPLAFFLAFFATNAVVFLFAFQPLLHRERIPLPVLELLVVLLDGLAIKLLAHWDALQTGNCQGVSWSRALVLASIGNALSYFVGLIAAHKPWVMESGD